MDSKTQNLAVAIIPARGGSKGVPGKNLRTVGGVPLVVRAIRSCLAAKEIAKVVVSTDCAEIAAVARAAGASIIERPSAISTDIASSEEAVIHALTELRRSCVLPPITVFVQCTSPFILADDLDAAVHKLSKNNADTVISIAATHRFLWRREGNDLAGINHDGKVRLRRQDLDPQYEETGAFYVLNTSRFISSGQRFMDRTMGHEVPQWTAVEIDTELDLAVSESLAIRAHEPIKIDALITDFDGVHTDDTAYVTEDGTEMVRVSRSDGMGISMLREIGLPMLILSKEKNPVVTERSIKLSMDVLQGVDNKLPHMLSWLTEMGIEPSRAAYVGNDINDLECMSAVGFPIAVADASPVVKASARVILMNRGGQGALRELADRILLARNDEN